MHHLFLFWFFVLIWKIQLVHLFITQDFIHNNSSYRKREHSLMSNSDSIFSPVWTNWSPCNNQCIQVREKHCINKQKCINLVLREERPCSNIICQSISNLDNININRIPVKPNFQKMSIERRVSLEPIVQYQSMKLIVSQKNNTDVVNRPSHSHYYTSRQEHTQVKSRHNDSRLINNIHHKLQKHSQQLILSSPAVHNQGHQHHNNAHQNPIKHQNTTNFNYHLLNNELYSSPLLNYNTHSSNSNNQFIKQNKINNNKSTNSKRNLYTKWSNWTKCTRSCTTQRFKYCKKKGTCKKNVIKETAYCYVQDSPCHRWIADHFGINYDDDSEEVELNSKLNNEDDYDYKIEEIPNNYQKDCGISLISNSYIWPTLRIIGGRVSAKQKWPWQVVLLNKYKIAFCGGTLIAPQWILTAAHCLRKHIYVRINEHDLSYKDGSELEFRIRKKIAHKDYNPDTVDNDIALLKLPVEVSQSYVCLPRHNQSLPYNMMCTITGWGKRHVKDERGTKLLHEAEVPIVPRSECRHAHKNLRITSNMFCAGYKNGGRDTCAGDSGGPLVCQSKPADLNTGAKPWFIHGITSFGEGCGRRSKYGIYIAVDNYVKWIREVIKNN